MSKYDVNPEELAKVRRARTVEVDGQKFQRQTEGDAVYFESPERFMGDGAVVVRLSQGRARILESDTP